MRLTRRQFAATGALALAATRARAADTFQFKIGCDTPADHPLSTRLGDVAAEVGRAIGPGGWRSMYSPTASWAAMRTCCHSCGWAGMELFAAPSLTLSTLVPLSGLPSIGFALKSYDQVWPAMDGALGELVRGAIRKTGMVPFTRSWDNGFRQITTSGGPVQGPDDLRGLKLRVPVTPFMVSLFSSLGASPTSLGFNEVYSALQTHVIDGQENPLAQVETAKLFEVQKSCALTNHCWSGYWILANRRALASLPDDLRDMMEHVFDTTALVQRADLRTMDTSLQATLVGQGLGFTRPDPAAFQALLRSAGFYAKWQAAFGPGGLEGVGELCGGGGVVQRGQPSPGPLP